jgi:hypothetical protein
MIITYNYIIRLKNKGNRFLKYCFTNKAKTVSIEQLNMNTNQGRKCRTAAYSQAMS